MKNKIKICLAFIMLTMVVFSNFSDASAHTHKWKFDYSETEYCTYYNSAYHKEDRILHYYCICGKTKTTEDTIYTCHRYDNGVCEDCGCQE